MGPRARSCQVVALRAPGVQYPRMNGAPPIGFTLSPAAKWLLGFGVFCFFMLTGSRERPWADATPMYEVADAIVNRGELHIATAWPEDLHEGRGGKIYAIAPLLQSLQHVPGVFIRKALVSLWPGTYELSWPFAAHVGPAALGALTVVLFLALVRLWGASLRAALVMGAALAVGTMLWVYARSSYSECLQAACFTWLAVEVTRVGGGELSRRRALALGAAAGLLVNAKSVYALALGGAAAYLLVRLWPRRAALARLVGTSLFTFVPLVALLPLYNWLRWESPWHAGYNLDIPVFEERLLMGLWGLFLSPGKSVFVYCPPLLLSVVALPRLWRTIPALGLLTIGLVGPVLALYGKMLYWSGDYAWGPRYLLFAVPLLLVPGTLWLDDAWQVASARVRRLRLAGAALVVACGVFVSFLGSAFYWDHFIRISQQARRDWLGSPDRSGAPTPEVDGLCGACFEDTHQLHWLPPFHPVEGHSWLLRHAWAGSDAKAALADAPWVRYTRKPLAAERAFARVRFDWWPLTFFDRGRGGMAVVLGAWFVFGMAVVGFMLPQRLRQKRT